MERECEHKRITIDITNCPPQTQNSGCLIVICAGLVGLAGMFGWLVC